MSEKAQAQKKASSDLDALLKSTRPKGFSEGLSSGLGSIVGGAVGGAGAVVLAPVVGAGVGSKKAGVLGGAAGFTGGMVLGVVAGGGAAVAGLGMGIFQLGRGAKALPTGIIGPASGKWWDDTEGRWISTNLETEDEDLKKVPKDDKDLLGDAADEEPETTEGPSGGEVVDPFYYDALGVDHDASPSKIKRQYYLLARKYHPDKAGPDDKEAASKFKDVSEAYQVLSDEELRAKYDKEGRDGLSADKTSVIDTTRVDAAILFAFLFGSDKFNDYVGRLAMATSAMAGQEIGPKDARTLQNRRCARLALKLAAKIDGWISDKSGSEKNWTEEAKELSTASYGSHLLQAIGMVYSLSATQFLGSIDSGIGMPSISKWAKNRKAQVEKRNFKSKAQMEGLSMAMSLAKIQEKFETDVAAAVSEEEKSALTEKFAEDQINLSLEMMWVLTTVDITTALHQTCQMVFFDKSVDKKVHKERAEGVLKLGEIFTSCPTVEEEGENKTAKEIYEAAAFAAMIETVKRKEEESFEAQK